MYVAIITLLCVYALIFQFVIAGKFLSEEEVNTMLFAPKEKGQGLVEYALILVLVAVVVIAVLTILGPIIGNVFSNINSGLQG